jgi:hypothetical protein
MYISAVRGYVGTSEVCGELKLCCSVMEGRFVLLARNRSSERIAMALMRSTATAHVSEMLHEVGRCAALP